MRTYEDLLSLKKQSEKLYEDMQYQADHVREETMKLDHIQSHMAQVDEEIEELEKELYGDDVDDYEETGIWDNDQIVCGDGFSWRVSD